MLVLLAKCIKIWSRLTPALKFIKDGLNFRLDRNNGIMLRVYMTLS
jgi:hypothetical protein